MVIFNGTPVEGTFLGINRTQQTVLVGGLSFALMSYVLVNSSAVDTSYDPLLLGVGLVMVVYAVVVAVHDFVLG
ncbi:hypothetical protein SAMN05192554_10239 [Haloarchaeobius iranensis]|uniref:Uncharacterized protein n=1 Tax=Haloarchaeobius iranensis TaxID=996166 RepID=A0A1G9SYV7_9EURY|nr:hypothetical protein SAMN05192554_10239 [Haloarchaeobius iranensis]